MKTVDELVAEFLVLGDEIAALEAKRTKVKDDITVSLDLTQAEPGRVWEYDGVGRVIYVKGRASKTLNPILLMKSGVTAEVITACTTKSFGNPHLRVEPIKE